MSFVELGHVKKQKRKRPCEERTTTDPVVLTKENAPARNAPQQTPYSEEINSPINDLKRLGHVSGKKEISNFGSRRVHFRCYFKLL